MFNTNLSMYGPRSLDVKVEKTSYEYRAPTDDSIRILDEMRDKVIKGILDCGSVELNVKLFRWAVHPSREHIGFDIDFALTINGGPVEGRATIGRMTLSRLKGQELCSHIREQLYEAIKKAISYALLDDILREAQWKIYEAIEGKK
jgi:hypothetical protein